MAQAAGDEETEPLYPDVDPFLEVLDPQDGMVCADFGLGNPEFTLEVADRVQPSGKVFVVARDPQVLMEIREKAAVAGLGNVEAVQPADRGLTIAQDTVDAAWSVNQFHALDAPTTHLDEVQQLLKPDGRFFVIDWKSTKTPSGPPLRQRVTLITLFKVLREAGFGTLKNHDIYEHHHVVEVRP